MGERFYRVQAGSIVWTDTRALAEAKTERIAFMRARCLAEINNAIGDTPLLYFAAFGVSVVGDPAFDQAKTAIAALKTKLATKTTAINAAVTNAAVDAVEW